VGDFSASVEMTLRVGCSSVRLRLPRRVFHAHDPVATRFVHSHNSRYGTFSWVVFCLLATFWFKTVNGNKLSKFFAHSDATAKNFVGFKLKNSSKIHPRKCSIATNIFHIFTIVQKAFTFGQRQGARNLL
jgi:hypothetical protein